jgi:hypothetical protein
LELWDEEGDGSSARFCGLDDEPVLLCASINLVAWRPGVLVTSVGFSSHSGKSRVYDVLHGTFKRSRGIGAEL